MRSTQRVIYTVFSICLCMAIPIQSEPLSYIAPSLITGDHAEAIYKHLLENHWVEQTGLFLSFPDSGDRKLSQQASLYEQGAVGLLAIRFGDINRAKALFQFLRDAWLSAANKPGRNGLRGLPNFFNGDFGTEGIEKTIHTGPNAWVGLFEARLANTTKDAEIMQGALDIEYWIETCIPHENGAVAMGPRDEPGGAPWTKIYSTENNLSYYAFLTELLRSPRLEKAERERITAERDRVENWLIHTTINSFSDEVRRGTNPGGIDRMQALDTVTWMISAIGPQHLAARGIDPFKLMRSVEKSFEVTVGGRWGVDPTDQTEADLVFQQRERPAADHHRMIWYEGMGQYAVALSSLADYAAHLGKIELAHQLMIKAQQLIQGMDQASLKNYPDKAAYPYATAGRFFRDGWNAPADGTDGPASSLISAAWRCFAGLGIDPLTGREINSVQHAHVAVPENIHVAQNRHPVLYGISEDMVVHAWQALDRNDLDGAIAQAQATIQEWSPWAMQLQQKKLAEVGHLVDYSGQESEKKTIFNYWALNDVAAAYFILGKAYDEKRDFAHAARAFQQIANHYSLAQVWDPKGWFWAPVDAITNEYAYRDPVHYGSVVPQVLAEGQVTGKRPY